MRYPFDFDFVLILRQATLSLLVTNLQIVSMVIYRKFRGSDVKSQDRKPNDRPFDSDAGTTTRERRRSIIDYPTTLPSYTVTIASLAAPTSISSEQDRSTSVPQSTSASSGVPSSSQPTSTSNPQSISIPSSVPSSQPISTSEPSFTSVATPSSNSGSSGHSSGR